MMQAAVYARVSTRAQKEDGTSLASQVERCRAFAEAKGYHIPDGMVLAEDWPGATLDRPFLENLRGMVRRREVQAVICYSVDRLSRVAVHVAILAEEADRAGVELLFVTEPLENSPEGQLIRYVRGYAAQVEREKIKDRTVRGKRERARAGGLPTSVKLYGYTTRKGDVRTGGGKRQIVESEAATVRKMFEWAESGVSLVGIRTKLHEKGILSPLGSEWWGQSQIRRVLHNEAYTGKTIAFKYASVEPRSASMDKKRYKNTRRELRPESETIELPDVTPALISRSTFESIQRQMQQRKMHPQCENKNQYLLGGRIFCRTCGHALSGEPTHGKRIYRCLGRRHPVPEKRCRQTSFNADELEAGVWAEVSRVMSNPESVIAELERRKEESQTIGHLEQRLDQLDREVSKLDRQYNLSVDAFTEEAITMPELKKRKAQTDAKKNELDAERKDIAKKILTARSWNMDPKAVDDIRALAQHELKNFSYEDRRTLLKGLSVKVWVKDSDVTVSGVFNPDRGTLSRQSWSAAAYPTHLKGQEFPWAVTLAPR